MSQDMLSTALWVFVGIPIIVIGLIAVALIINNERQFRKEMREIENERRGWH